MFKLKFLPVKPLVAMERWAVGLWDTGRWSRTSGECTEASQSKGTPVPVVSLWGSSCRAPVPGLQRPGAALPLPSPSKHFSPLQPVWDRKSFDQAFGRPPEEAVIPWKVGARAGVLFIFSKSTKRSLSYTNHADLWWASADTEHVPVRKWIVNC